MTYLIIAYQIDMKMVKIVLKNTINTPLIQVHGSLHVVCWPGTQRRQPSPQLHPAHAAVCGIFQDEHWPVLPMIQSLHNKLITCFQHYYVISINQVTYSIFSSSLVSLNFKLQLVHQILKTAYVLAVLFRLEVIS